AGSDSMEYAEPSMIFETDGIGIEEQLDNYYLSISDFEEGSLPRFKGYFKGWVIVVGCDVAEGGEGARNLVNAMAASLPASVTVMGQTGGTWLKGVKMDGLKATPVYGKPEQAYATQGRLPVPVSNEPPFIAFVDEKN
ncbi:MAG: hypothetical protein Q7S00_08195, partial [bacterium]|nr:hypothetical protein [bacterium]